VHTLNGFREDNPVIHELPIPGLLMSWDTGDIFEVNGTNDITVFAEKQDKSYYLCRIKNTDIHIMNKWAINRHSDKLIELYGATA
jgi:hypothetical protein